MCDKIETRRSLLFMRHIFLAHDGYCQDELDGSRRFAVDIQPVDDNIKTVRWWEKLTR